VKSRPPSLDDVFIKYTGHEMRDVEQLGPLAESPKALARRGGR
jgi:hypothetical protein